MIVNRREFVRLGALGAALAGPACAVAAGPAAEFELEEVSIAALQDGMRAGRWTSQSVATLYLERIEKIDRSGPAINSIIELNPDALDIARQLDAERKAKGARGPLHGIPVLIKDNIGTADRMRTSAGSLALALSTPRTDAFAVRKLREAGVVILGKTNLSEWANFRSAHSTSGWSGRGRLTRNPYALDRNTSGSSSGSGAATSANLCAASIGTETDGSVVSPSSVNGIVGIKPTLGLVSRSGIIPIAHSQDTAGPMARSVADAALLLGAIVGPDPKDSSTGKAPGQIPQDYTRFLDPGGLKGARLGIVRHFFGFNDAVDRVLEEAVDAMKRLGAVIIDPAELPNVGKYNDSETEVLLCEFKADLNAYLAGLPAGVEVRSLKDLIEFNERNKEKEMPYFGQDLFVKAEAKGPLSDPAYRKGLRRNQQLSGREGIDAAMTKHRLDALVAPTEGPAWMTDLVNGDHFSGGCSTPAAVAGYPHITLPAGYVFGLPVGISLFGRAYSEPVLIRIAYALEQATRVRRPPRFLPTAEL
jgi:amidase